jgi:hypothetical protein
MSNCAVDICSINYPSRVVVGTACANATIVPAKIGSPDFAFDNLSAMRFSNPTDQHE